MGAFLTIYQRLPIYADVMTDPAATWVIVRFHRPPFLPCVVVDSFLTFVYHARPNFCGQHPRSVTHWHGHLIYVRITVIACRRT